MKRYIIIQVIFMGLALSLNAQTATMNYVMTETMLNNSATQIVKTIQYYDGLGRPVEQVQGGISTGGKYLHTMQTYDSAGREKRTTLPCVGTTSLAYKGASAVYSALQQTYSDSLAYSETTFDALGRPTFISTPGQHWAGKGKHISYITNAANSVKKYINGTSFPTEFTYYPAGSLTGEVRIDEDSVMVTTYKDIMGRVVLERRGDNDDTYYVYYDNGLLHFILQPMFQESPSAYYRFRYNYDTHGRLTAKYLPGCSSPINYWYDPANRIIAEQDPRLSSAGRYRFYLYDYLGRNCIQGTCTDFTHNPPLPVIVGRVNHSFANFCQSGYLIPVEFSVSDPEIEIINYYDDYSFLSATACAALIGNNDFSLTNPVNANSLLTGTITATSDGHRLLCVNYFDERGRTVDTRQTLLNGDFLQTETTYSFTDKPLTIQNTLTANGQTFEIEESYTYSQQTDQLTACDVSYNDTTVRVNSFTYNNLGHFSDLRQGDNHFSTLYSYNLHGWLTSAYTTKLINGYQYLFTQDLYYETGSGTPCYNGNISSMRWRTNSDTYGHGFKFTYDKRNRLTEAGHTLYDMSTYPICYSETMSYNRNSAITSLTRTSNGQGYGNIDQLTYTYTGNRLKAISDAASPSVYNGSFEFVKKANHTQEYWYNTAGDLARDKNKGLALIEYDFFGNPTRIQFRNGNVTEYVYSAAGQKLREKHTTAIDGLTVSYGQTMELTPAQIMAADTTDYSGPWMFRRRGNPNVTYLDAMSYHFDGGYMTFYPVPVPSPIPNLPPVYNYVCNYHYYIRDYQGNNRVVVSHDGTVEQTNDYYAYGGPWGNTSTNQGFQPFKYNGKELDRIHGLDWYDYGARRYDPAFAQFTQMDPLCEQYPHLSPYAYCAGNPVNAIDPDGCDTLNISYANNQWLLSKPIIAKGDDIFNVSVGKVTSTYTFSEKEYGNRVNMLNLEIGDDKNSYTLGVYHISGAEEGGTGFYVTPGGLPSTIVNSGLRIPDGVYPITAPTGGEKWRKPGVGGTVSGRGIRFHYAGTSNARAWTQGCFILSSSYSKSRGMLLFDPNESINASRAFDVLLGGTKHYSYSIKGMQREGTLFPSEISKFLILKSLY